MKPMLRGVHHLALCTDDMKATVDFYVDVLGMPLVHAMKVPEGLGTGAQNRGNPPYEGVRHYFFDMGNDSLLAFFEIPKGAEPRGNRNAIGAMQHCAFVVTPQRFGQIEEQLRKAGVDYIGPIPSSPVWSASTSSIRTAYGWSSPASPGTASCRPWSIASRRPGTRPQRSSRACREPRKTG